MISGYEFVFSLILLHCTVAIPLAQLRIGLPSGSELKRMSRRHALESDYRVAHRVATITGCMNNSSLDGNGKHSAILGPGKSIG